MLEVNRDLIRQRLSGRNTALRGANWAVVVSRVVEVDAVRVQRGGLVTETVRGVDSDSVVLVDLDHGGTAGRG